MKKILITLALLIIFFNGYSQTKWVAQNPGTTENLEDVHFFSKDTGMVVGAKGYIGMTYDGCKTWDTVTSNTNNDLYEIFFINRNIGWIAGDYVLLKTTNGGKTWSSPSTNVPSQLNTGIHFQSEDIGYMTGSQVYITTNGGKNWSVLTQGNAFKHSVTITPNNDVYVCGNSGAMGKSTDLTTFSLMTPPNASNLYKIQFMNDSVGVAVGDLQNIIYTNDAGANWSLRTTASTGGLIGLCTTNKGNWWAVGGFGKIKRSIDSGITWSDYASGVQNVELRDVFFLNDDLGWAVGAGTVIKYENPAVNTINIIKRQFEMYPNPANGLVNIKNVEVNSRITITDEIGRLVLDKISIDKLIQVKTMDFKPGVYLVSITNNRGENTSQKLIIQ
jgi:photosystem II stability/assembly factor-like uncharacterized protein